MEYPHSLRLQSGQMGAGEDPLRLTGGKTAAPTSSGGAAAQGLSTRNRRSQGLLETKRALSGVAGMPGGGPESARPAGDADSRPLGSPWRGCGALLPSQPAHSPVPPSSHCSRLHFAFFCSGISFSQPFFGFMHESSLLAF